MKYKSGYKYQLEETITFLVPIYSPSTIELDYLQLEPNGTLTIKKGYAWNGADVVIDSKNVIVPSLVHDALYQLMRNKKLPHYYWKVADLTFYNLCLSRGMWKPRAWYMRRGLSAARGAAALPSHKREVKTVP